MLELCRPHRRRLPGGRRPPSPPARGRPRAPPGGRPGRGLRGGLVGADRRGGRSGAGARGREGLRRALAPPSASCRADSRGARGRRADPGLVRVPPAPRAGRCPRRARARRDRRGLGGRGYAGRLPRAAGTPRRSSRASGSGSCPWAASPRPCRCAACSRRCCEPSDRRAAASKAASDSSTSSPADAARDEDDSRAAVVVGPGVEVLGRMDDVLDAVQDHRAGGAHVEEPLDAQDIRSAASRAAS